MFEFGCSQFSQVRLIRVIRRLMLYFDITSRQGPGRDSHVLSLAALKKRLTRVAAAWPRRDTQHMLPGAGRKGQAQ